MSKSIRADVLFLLLCAAMTPSALSQGSLTPPGRPAPSMKTLDQIEPRTDLATLAGDASYQHVIAEAGSYYLTGPLDVTKTHGIDVRVAGVTIDLNGFEIRRTDGTGGRGIEVDAVAARCTIRNGSIGGFANAVQSAGPSGSLIDTTVYGCLNSGASLGEGWHIEGVEALNNGGAGVAAGRGSTFVKCTARGNTGATSGGLTGGAGCTFVDSTAAANSGYGFFGATGSTFSNCTANENGNHGFVVSSGSSLANCTARENAGNGFDSNVGDSSFTNCTALENTGTYGFRTGGGATLTHCTATDNTSAAPESAGISTGSGSTVIGCTANNNRNSNAPGTQTGVGISAGSGSTVRDCTTKSNAGDGIRVTSGCQVIGNNSRENGSSGFSAGIQVTSHSNRIEGNNVTGNRRGFSVQGEGNLIVRNTARANGANYNIGANNRYGAILDLTAAGSPAAIGDAAAGTLTTTTNPWANFAY